MRFPAAIAPCSPVQSYLSRQSRTHTHTHFLPLYLHAILRGPINQPLHSQIPPDDLPLRLRGTRDPEGCMLVGNHIVLVFRIQRLMLGWDIDWFFGQVRRAVEFLIVVSQSVM